MPPIAVVELVSIQPELLGVMLSGFLRRTKIETARAIGIREVRPKPNTVEELIFVLRRHVLALWIGLLIRIRLKPTALAPRSHARRSGGSRGRHGGT